MSVDQLGYLNLGAPTRNPFNYEKFEQIARDNATAWLTLAEIRQQLNLFDDTSQDTYLSSLELATRQAIEDYLGMSIFATSYRVYYNATSLYGTPLSLDLPEVSQNNSTPASGVTITNVKYFNDATPPVLTTVSSSTYYYDNSGNKVVLQTLPSDLNSNMTSPVSCEYVSPVNPIALYPVVKQAGLLLLTHLYNHRSDTTDGNSKPIPFGVATLLRPYKPLVMYMVARYENIAVKTLSFSKSDFGEQSTTQTLWFQTRATIADVSNNVRISDKYRVYSDIVQMTVNYTPNIKLIVDNQNAYSITWRGYDWRIDNVRETNDRQFAQMTCVRNDPVVAV